MFKGYLSSQLEAKDKSTENKAKMLQEANDLKFKGNRKQYEMNAHISYIFNQIEANIDNPAEIKKLIEAGQQSIKKRQKLIRLADRSKDGGRSCMNMNMMSWRQTLTTRSVFAKPGTRWKRNAKM